MAWTLLALAVFCAHGKVVDVSSRSSGPEILSQFCFPTVSGNQGKGSIAVEAESSLQGQRVAFLKVVSSAEARAILASNCEVFTPQHIIAESAFTFSLSTPDAPTYNYVDIDSLRTDYCVTAAVVSCDVNDPQTDVSMYVEYLNDNIDSWGTGLSLEDQGIPELVNFYTTVFSVMFLIALKFIGDSEKVGAHGDLVVTSSVAYYSLEVEMGAWLGYYWMYALFGSPVVMLKSVACYAHWVFELATIALLSMHATGHFITAERVINEVKIFLVAFGAVTLYVAALRATESEANVQFHWFSWSRGVTWTRLVAAMLQVVWSVKGFTRRKGDAQDLFGILAYTGFLWTMGAPAIIWLTEMMARYRWKYYQAFLALFGDVSFMTFLLVFLHPQSAALLFAQENVLKSLKENKV